MQQTQLHTKLPLRFTNVVHLIFWAVDMYFMVVWLGWMYGRGFENLTTAKDWNQFTKVLIGKSEF